MSADEAVEPAGESHAAGAAHPPVLPQRLDAPFGAVAFEDAAALRCETISKINLFLAIRGRRADGYHEIATAFQAIDYGDLLEAWPCGEIVLDCVDPLAGPPERNLVWRAATLLRQRYGVRDGVRLRLTKRVPIGAGLGGGSGDAAAALHICARLWGLEPPLTELEELALLLGADVPFLLRGGAAWAEGVGERLHDAPSLPPCEILVVTPVQGVETPWAYRQFGLQPGQSLPDQSHIDKFMPLFFSDRLVLDDLRGTLHNSFEEVVFPACPHAEILKREMIAMGAVAALLSGSGSSVFGLFPSRELPGSWREEWEGRGARFRWSRPVRRSE